MADTRYVVAIDFEVGDLKIPDAKMGKLAGLGPGSAMGKLRVNGAGAVESITGKLESMSRAASAAVGRVADAFTGAVEKAGDLAVHLGTIGTAAGIAAVTYGVTSLNSEIEKTKIGLADILTSNGVTDNLDAGLSAAAGLMQQIRKDAAALPGETADLAGIFKLAAIPGLQAGGSTDRIEKLSANAMAFGMGVANLDSGTVARELSMLISGRAGSHNILGLQLAGLGGDKAQAFNSKSAADRLAFLEKEFAKHARSIDLFSDSFEGLSSTLKDNAKLFLTTMTGGLFERVKGALRDATGWFSQNRGAVMKWSDLVGGKLVDAFDFARNEIALWLPAVEAFAENAYAKIRSVWDRLEPTVSRFGEVARKALADPATIDKLEGVLKLYAAVKLGQGLAPEAGSAFTIAKGAGSLFAGLGGGAGAGEGAAAAAGGLAVSGPIALAALAALGIAAVGAAGAVDDLTDATSEYHASAVSLASQIGALSSGAMMEWKITLGQVEEAIKPVADQMGLNLLAGLKGLATVSAEAAVGVRDLISPITQLPSFLADMLGGAGRDASGRQTKAGGIGKAIAKGYGDSITDATQKALVKPGAGGGGGGVKIGTQINHFTIANNQEPSRIARVVKQTLAEKSRYPTASPYATNYSRAPR